MIHLIIFWEIEFYKTAANLQKKNLLIHFFKSCQPIFPSITSIDFYLLPSSEIYPTWA